MNALTRKIAVAAVASVIVIVIEMAPAMTMAQPMTVDLTDSSKGLILDPIAVLSPQFADGSGTVGQFLSNLCSGQPDQLTPNVGGFLQMGSGKYGVIFINTHGPEPGDSDYLMTAEPLSGPSTRAYRDDVISHPPRLIHDFWGPPINADVWEITPAFVGHYAKGLPPSIVYVSACNSYQDTEFSSAFFGNGAKAYFGYNDNVTNGDATITDDSMFSVLTNLLLDPDQRTTSKAYQLAGSGTALELDASSVQNLVLQGGVINGGFDRGDTTGWTPTFVAGAGPYSGYDCKTDGPGPCSPAGPGPYVSIEPKPSPVASSNTTPNRFSVQIGKYGTQFYCDSWELGCHFKAGEEPDEDDQLYQDIQLGSGPPNGPSNFILSFWYDIKSYEDTNDYGDFFYVQVQDLSTGTAPDLEYYDEPLLTPWMADTFVKESETGWQNSGPIDLSSFQGDLVRLTFGVHQGGWGPETAAYVDNVSVNCK